jgi:hypothetical protein
MCRTTPAEAECDGVVVCAGSPEAAVPCATECEGELVPPETVAGCEQTAQARLWLQASCSAATPVPLYEPAGEPDAGATGDFDPQLLMFLSAFGGVLELNERAMLALQAAAVLNAALPELSEALALASEDDADLACPIALLGQAPVSLGQAGADINSVLVDTSTLIAEVP